jgi:hypothetical protein
MYPNMLPKHKKACEDTTCTSTCISHASEDWICNSKCVNQNSSMPAKLQNISLLVLKKHMPGITQKISQTCTDKTPPMRARNYNESQHKFSKHLPCQQRHKIQPNHSHVSEDKIYLNLS